MTNPWIAGLGGGLESLGGTLQHEKDLATQRKAAMDQLIAGEQFKAADRNQWKYIGPMDFGDGRGPVPAVFNQERGQTLPADRVPQAGGSAPPPASGSPLLRGGSNPSLPIAPPSVDPAAGGPIAPPPGGGSADLAMAKMTGTVPVPSGPSADAPPPVVSAGPPPVSSTLPGNRVPVAPPAAPVVPPAVPTPSAGGYSTSGIPRVVPRTLTVPKIDPNSAAGISADSAKAANRALVRPDPLARKSPDKFMVDGVPTVLLKDGHGTLTTVSGQPVTGTVSPYVPPSGGGLGGGGFGAGGIGGAGRTIAAINGLHQANDQMTPYEEAVRNKSASFDGLDYFKTQMGRMYDAKGIVDPAIHSAVMAQLGAQNPALANYLQNGEMWALEESSIPGSRPSDFRTKLDAFVSSLKPNASDQMINSVQRGRTTRLEGYDQSVPALKASLARVAGTPVQPGNAPPSSTKRTPQQAWDEAVKLYGEARVLKEFGPRPPE